ncbi:hypothetical protein HMPREF3219_0200020 [Streptococcus salivarius]|nr:hypothetical protein HMPREF3219_0200020 [Streptococcus salivarius]
MKFTHNSFFLCFIFTPLYQKGKKNACFTANVFEKDYFLGK